MRKSRRIFLLTVLLTVVGVLAWTLIQPAESEPTFQGKALSFWLLSSGNSANDASTHESMEAALAQSGSNAIPTLLRLLRACDSTLKTHLVALLQKQHFFRIDSIPADAKNFAALQGFLILSARDVKPAVPDLINIFEQRLSPASQRTTATLLGELGPDAAQAVPALIKAMSGAQPELRKHAIDALGHIHSQPRLAVPALILALRDPDPGLRSSALEALANFDLDSVIPPLIACLTDPNPEARCSVIDALKNFGAQARSAVPALRKALNDADARVREKAANALSTIDPETAAKIPPGSPVQAKRDRLTDPKTVPKADNPQTPR